MRMQVLHREALLFIGELEGLVEDAQGVVVLFEAGQGLRLLVLEEKLVGPLGLGQAFAAQLQDGVVLAGLP